MNGFIKVLMALFAMFATVIGALAIFDKISNKYRIKGDYLDCESNDFADIEE